MCKIKLNDKFVNKGFIQIAEIFYFWQFYMPPKRRTSPKKSGKKGSSSLKKIAIALAILLLFSLGSSFYYYYGKVFKPNLTLNGQKTGFVYIKSTDTFDDVVHQLSEKKMLRNRESFIWMAEFLKYKERVLPGRYRVKDRMSNKELISLLRSGKQEPLRITIQNLRTKEQLAGKIGRLLEADSISLIQYFNDDSKMKKLGLSPASALSYFMPDTYEFYWNTPTSKFMERMGKAYDKFWNDDRRKLAANMGLTPAEVTTLASIVMQESNRADEWPIIAGVYYNRFIKGMKLQADPTVKFALNDASIRRIRSNHLQVESPYNTYKYAGLPPGPIYMSSPKCIDAVLGYQHHNYIYFCAKPDGSGYHAFAVTYEQHLQNARKYQRNLNQRGI